MEINLSEYATELCSDVKYRYFKKIKVIGFDPYVVNSNLDWCSSIKNVPKVKYSTIHEYLVLRKSYYTKDEFHAKKALASFDLTACGWVRNFKWKKSITSTLTVIICEVLHSMRLNEAALSPWVIYNTKKFRVVSAHCNCMAGQGEACSHIGALLFYALVAGKSNADKPSVTGSFAYWLLPAAQKKKISPKKLEQLVLKKPVVGAALPCIAEHYSSVSVKSKLFPKKRVTSWQELVIFLKELQHTAVKSVVFDVVAAFNQPKEEIRNTPPCSQNTTPRSLVIDPIVFISSKRNDILLETDSIIGSCDEKNFYHKFVKITSVEATNLFHLTVEQSNSLDWRKYRQIRITGSVSYSLYTYFHGKKQDWIKKIEGVIFPTFRGNAATRYGQANEKHALSIFQKKHRTMQLSFCGLLVNVSYPFMAFSPDAVAKEQDGKYVLIEVKCPQLGLTHGGIELCKHLDYITFEKNIPELKEKHTYYGQIQLGLFLCGIDRCILLIYSEKFGDVVEIDVKYNEKFCKSFVHTLKNVYFQHFLPYLVQQAERLLINSPNF